MRIALDAMGGDHAPEEIVHGAAQGLRYLSADDQLVLYGQADVVRAVLKSVGLNDARVVIEDCPQIVEMDESPRDVVRQKRDSSIFRMAVDAGERKVDAMISAGNTGAMAACCQLKVGPIEGCSRPGIACVLPTFHGPVIVCDVGANVAPKPHHLYEYARMTRVYGEVVLGMSDPAIGLVSIGEEAEKGNSLVKEARKLITNDPSLKFAGNLEGRDVFAGAAEICISDGFTGNVILKLTEGLAEGLFKTILGELAEEGADLSQRFKPIVDKIWRKHDFAEYGGAPLLGINSVVIICHGRSDRRAIGNAIRVAVEGVRAGINRAIAESLRATAPAGGAG
ncbi:MAG: phosphate acyltransferase PlsX [Phycisphaerales bacterium]|nr:phosphate acyltransferase PlsX [Phycisphaerales bacterium]